MNSLKKFQIYKFEITKTYLSYYVIWTHTLSIFAVHALKIDIHFPKYINVIINNALIFVFAIRMQLANVGKILRVRFAFDSFLFIVNIKLIVMAQNISQCFFKSIFRGQFCCEWLYFKKRSWRRREIWHIWHQSERLQGKKHLFLCICFL